MTGFILYTYQTVNGLLVCHAYGPVAQQGAAQLTGESLQQGASQSGEPALEFMVLPLEAMPV